LIEQGQPLTNPKDELKESTFVITGMSCASCVDAIESKLIELKGVEKVTVNLLEEVGKVTYRLDLITPQEIAAEINELGFQAEIVDELSEDEISFQFVELLNERNTEQLSNLLKEDKGVLDFSFN